MHRPADVDPSCCPLVSVVGSRPQIATPSGLASAEDSLLAWVLSFPGQPVGEHSGVKVQAFQQNGDPCPELPVGLSSAVLCHVGFLLLSRGLLLPFLFTGADL